MDQATTYRIGRFLLDGQNVSWVAARYKIDEEAVNAAWRVCLLQLAPAMDLAEDSSVTVIACQVMDRSEEAVRLLLEWQERIEVASAFSSETGVESEADDTDAK